MSVPRERVRMKMHPREEENRVKAEEVSSKILSQSIMSVVGEAQTHQRH